MMSTGNRRLAGAVAGALLLGGCTALPLDQGRRHVAELVESRSGMATGNFDDREIAAWLAQPLTADRAQRIALLRNPAWRRQYASLGLDAADVYEAGRLGNPLLELSWLLPLGSVQGEKFGAAASLGFADLLLRGSRLRIARLQFEAAQHALAAQVLELLADTQVAWLQCVAGEQRVAVREALADTAQLGAELAERYQRAGNVDALTVQMQRAEATQAHIELRAARRELVDARARLQTLLGLRADEGSWQVSGVLPEVPGASAEAELPALLQRARAQRLDLAAAQRRAEALQQQTRDARRYRLLTDAQLGVQFERERDGARALGPRAGLGLPLFQQGQGAVARAEARRGMAQAEVEALQGEIVAGVEQQLRRLELARQQVLAFRDELIPQRSAVVDRLREQANFMLVDSFPVLLARQQQYAAEAGLVDASLDYWTTHIELLRATGSQRSTEASR